MWGIDVLIDPIGGAWAGTSELYTAAGCPSSCAGQFFFFRGRMQTLGLNV